MVEPLLVLQVVAGDKGGRVGCLGLLFPYTVHHCESCTPPLLYTYYPNRTMGSPMADQKTYPHGDGSIGLVGCWCSLV